MSSTLVLIALMLSLSIAVVFPELQYSKVNKTFSSEYQFMVDKQRRGFIILGLISVSSFFIALQTLSVAIFVFHLIIDVLFGIYTYIAFQVRSSSLQRNSFTYVDNLSLDEDNIEYLEQAV
tara:strand:- start:322 stop:684 length:363 start_codon:yes stop_codon:yes gene_type:complete